MERRENAAHRFHEIGETIFPRIGNAFPMESVVMKAKSSQFIGTRKLGLSNIFELLGINLNCILEYFTVIVIKRFPQLRRR